MAATLWIAYESSAPPPPRLHVVARLTQPIGAVAGTPDPRASAHLRWRSEEIEASWTRVGSGASATLRSPRLELGDDFQSIAVTRPPAARVAMILWSSEPRLEGADFARNRRALPAASDAASTLVLEAEALQSDRRRPVHYLFLHLPDGGAVAGVIESIAVVTARDRADVGTTVSRVAADGQTRDAFVATLPLVFRVTVPDGAYVTFAARMPSTAPAAKVRVTQSIGRLNHVRLEATLMPGRWEEFHAPLREAHDSTLALSVMPDAAGTPVYWSVPIVHAPDTASDRPNILVVVVDALRADVSTPFLQRMSSDSVVFRRAYAATSWTKPSIGTLLTSLYPWTHALGARYYADALPRDVATLQSILAANGYVTAQFSANPFTSAASGLDRGFDAAFMAPALGHDDGFAVGASEVVNRFLEWRARYSRARYFAYLHVVDAHGAKSLDEYRGAAHAVDTEIARLISRLGHFRSADDTLIVVTADHGEAFGEHGQTGHGQSVYEEEIRVPLIIRDPGSRAARVVDEPVHHVDLMPTLLDYAGVSVGPYALQGRSVRNTQSGFKASPVIVTKFTYPEDVAGSHDRSDVHGIVDFPWKLITITPPGQPRRRELYRLDDDPGERSNVAAANAGRVRQLEAALDAFLREQGGARVRFTSTFERGVLPSRPIPSRDVVEQLRSLGYVR